MCVPKVAYFHDMFGPVAGQVADMPPVGTNTEHQPFRELTRHQVDFLCQRVGASASQHVGEMTMNCLGKVTIHPIFSGTVLIFNNMSQKQAQFSHNAVCPIFGLVSWICPAFMCFLCPSATTCLHIGGQKIAQILYVQGDPASEANFAGNISMLR